MPYSAIILFIVSISGAVFSYLLLRSERRMINVLFSIFSISASIWALFLGQFIITKSSDNALLFTNVYYIAAAAIPLVFFYFSLFFKREETNFKKSSLLLVIPFILLILGFIFDQNLIIDEIFISGEEKDVVLNNLNYYYYSAYFIFFVILSYFNLMKTHSRIEDFLTQTQLKFVIIGTSIGFVLGMIFNLFLPAVGNYSQIWIGPLSIFVMVASVGYSIIKHHLFNLKVIATELFVFLLWFFVLIRLIVSEVLRDQVANGILLGAITLVGVFLIRTVRKEVETREKLEKLTKELEKANEKLKELDRLKTEFLSLASHQFRSPLTAMKGYASLILEGSYGEISPGVKEAVDRIFKSTQSLVSVVQDFLDVSRIEQGRMKYEFEKIDVVEMAKNVIDELKPNISKAGLKISLDSPGLGKIFSQIDLSKMRQVVINLIDNAQKYTPKGSIEVSVYKDFDKVMIEVSDTGIGIKEAGGAKLFEKFTRNKGASKINVKGTGLGLYVVKKIVEAHDGRIWAESPGEGKGSTFSVELKSA